jgi:hypothetical protein
MKHTLVLLSFLTATAAHAQTYLCSDGSYITRNSQTPVLHVTIDGVALECKLTAGGPGPGMCSADSENVCVGQQVAYGDCKTKWNEYGKCFRTDKLGREGNVICGCGVGE